MKDIIGLPEDLGSAIHTARKASGSSATDIARRSGRARSVLYRLERGEAVKAPYRHDNSRSRGGR